MNSTRTAANDSTGEGTTRNLVAISPFFLVKDLQVSVAFYRERLGFQLDFQGPDGDVYYAGVSRVGIGIMLKAILPDVLPIPNHTRHPWARWDAYIYTLDPDTLFDEFRQRGVSFVKELSFIDDGLWGFEITDADGYVLLFFGSTTSRDYGGSIVGEHPNGARCTPDDSAHHRGDCRSRIDDDEPDIHGRLEGKKPAELSEAKDRAALAGLLIGSLAGRTGHGC